jgi:Flp pilus assembly protein TadD
VSGYLRAFLFRDFNTAFELLDRAVRAGPNSAFAWARSGSVFNFVNKPAEARRRLEQAMHISPFDPHMFFTHTSLGHASYLEGDYEAAVAWCRQSYAENSNYTANLRFLAASLAATGLIEEAHRIGASLRRLEPGFTVRKFVDGYAYQDEHLRNRLGQYLMSAGLPE